DCRRIDRFGARSRRPGIVCREFGQPARTIGGGEVVETTDMDVADEDLRHAAPPAAAREHRLELFTVEVDANLAVIEAPLLEQVLGGDAVRADCGGVEVDGHSVPGNGSDDP